MTVAQSVHVLQHVTFIKHSVLQTQLTEKAAVTVVSNGQVIPGKQGRFSLCGLENFFLALKGCILTNPASSRPFDL